MARAQSLEAFRRKVEVEWPKRQEKDARALLVRTATEGHGRIMREQTARAGIAPAFAVYANRPGQTDIERVVLPGPIVFKYDYRREIALVALDELRKASPVVSGAYRDAHTIFINGVAITAFPAVLSQTDDIMIANPLPYARRIEVGKTKSGRAFVMQVQPHIYERVMRKLHTIYRDVARVTLEFADIPHAYVIKGKLSGSYGTAIAKRKGGGMRIRSRNQRRSVGKTVQSPCIVISPIN